MAAAPVLHGSALGAARLAARAVGDDVAPPAAAPRVTLPAPERVAIYERQYSIYRATVATLGALH